MKKDSIIILGAGDISIDRKKPETIFQRVADLLRSADIAFANSKQMFSNKGYPNPTHASYSDPRNIPALSYAGFDVISLANNHTQDWGPEGLLVLGSG